MVFTPFYLPIVGLRGIIYLQLSGFGHLVIQVYSIPALGICFHHTVYRLLDSWGVKTYTCQGGRLTELGD